MATNLTAKVTASVNVSTYAKTDTIGETTRAEIMQAVTSYAFGTGASKCDLLYLYRYTVTGNTDINLRGTLEDIFGDTINTEIVRAIYVHNRSTTAADNIYVGPLSATDAFLLPWVDANGKNLVGPGGTLLLDNPSDGYAIAEAADTIRLQYQGVSGSISVDFALLGVAGDLISSSSSSVSSSSTSSNSSSSTSSSSSKSVSTSSSSTAGASWSSSSSTSSKSSRSSSSTSSSTVMQSGSSSSSTSSKSSGG